MAIGSNDGPDISTYTTTELGATKVSSRKANMTEHQDIIRKIQAAGLIEMPSWSRPLVVSEEERARLANLLSVGDPLSETIVADRGQPDT